MAIKSRIRLGQIKLSESVAIDADVSFTGDGGRPVSYTHLTLPTILLV